MSIKEYILLLLSEESTEITFHVNKSLRFGLDKYNPLDEHPVSNLDAVEKEVSDLFSVLFLANVAGITIRKDFMDGIALLMEPHLSRKLDKIFNFMKTSIRCRTLHATEEEVDELKKKAFDYLSNIKNKQKD